MAKSGIITADNGSGIGIEVTASDPKTANLGTLALDILRSQAAGDTKKVLLIQIGNERKIAVANAVDAAAGYQTAAATGAMTIAATLVPDDTTKTSSQWTSTDGTGTGHALIDALVDPDKPYRTLGGMISAVEDEVLWLQGLGTDIGCAIVVDQNAGNVKVYTGTKADADGTVEAADADSTVEEIFVQSISSGSGVDKLIFE